MKKQNKIAAMLGVCLLSFALSCNKEKPDCGCSSPSPVSYKNRTGEGKLSFQPIRNIYVITQTAPDGWHITSIYICNPSQKVIDLYQKDPSGNMQVSFKGDIKELCDPPVDIPERGHILIKLSEINELESL